MHKEKLEMSTGGGNTPQVVEGCGKKFTADDATWVLTASIVVFTMQTGKVATHLVFILKDAKRLKLQSLVSYTLIHLAQT